MEHRRHTAESSRTNSTAGSNSTTAVSLPWPMPMSQTQMVPSFFLRLTHASGSTRNTPSLARYLCTRGLDITPRVQAYIVDSPIDTHLLNRLRWHCVLSQGGGPDGVQPSPHGRYRRRRGRPTGDQGTQGHSVLIDFVSMPAAD